MDQTARDQQIVTNLRAFLKHQSERVALYKEFNDAFKEYIAKRITPEEYTTICSIVTQGFVELSIEIQALEAHLGDGTTPNVSAPVSVSSPSEQAPSSGSASATGGGRSLSLQSPEHAQLIREVQNLERTKLQLTVEGQKLLLAREEQERQEAAERRAEEQEERIVDEASRVAEEEEQQQMEVDVETTAVQQPNGCHHHHHQSVATAQSPRASSGMVLEQRQTREAWEEQMAEHKSRLDQVVEDINEKLADVHEAIALLVL